jgi:predicted RNase H-like HicB family nuclease
MADDRGYRILLSFSPEAQVFRARTPELDVDVEGDTRADALAKAEAAVEAAIGAAAQNGEDLPPPADAAPTGDALTLQIAPLVLSDLQFFAAQHGLPATELASQLLARAIGMLHGSPQRRPERRRDDEERRDEGEDRRGGRNRGRREGYRPDLDDKSNWLAYLREQEKGGGGGRGRR